MGPTPPRLLGELRDIVGATHVLVDGDVTERYRTDWTRRFRAPSAVVVRPGSATEVAAIVETCVRAETAVVPQGGNTGLVAGGVPLAGEVVVSSERLAGVEGVTASGDIVVRAGTTLGDVHRAAADHGRAYAVDIASRDSATVGGTIATNAGGLRVIRYGNTRDQLLGIELVTGGGDVISTMTSALRDNTGYHLPSLVAGSEGTLGVVTAARLRLVPPPAPRIAALLGFAGVHPAALAAETLRSSVPPVESVEIFLASGLELVCRVFDLPMPLGSPSAAYVLTELATHENPATAVEHVVEGLDGVVDVALGLDSTSRSRLWRYRELHTEAIAAIGVPHKLDVAVPPGTLGAFMEQVQRLVAQVAPHAQAWLFGHGGESTIHVNVTGLPADDVRVDEAVLELVASFGGSISAEHGIGRTKLPWIGLARSDAELRVFARVKRAFDPAGIMNPAVLVPRSAR